MVEHHSLGNAEHLELGGLGVGVRLACLEVEVGLPEGGGGEDGGVAEAEKQRGFDAVEAEDDGHLTGQFGLVPDKHLGRDGQNQGEVRHVFGGDEVEGAEALDGGVEDGQEGLEVQNGHQQHAALVLEVEFEAEEEEVDGAGGGEREGLDDGVLGLGGGQTEDEKVEEDLDAVVGRTVLGGPCERLDLGDQVLDRPCWLTKGADARSRKWRRAC